MPGLPPLLDLVTDPGGIETQVGSTFTDDLKPGYGDTLALTDFQSTTRKLPQKRRLSSMVSSTLPVFAIRMLKLECHLQCSFTFSPSRLIA